MKITKLGHSCVLLDDGQTTLLFDPGKWSDKQRIFEVEKADVVVYTHEHADHFSGEILQELISHHENIRIVANQSIAELIRADGITNDVAEFTEDIRAFSAPHEALPIPGVQAPSENGYHYKDLFSHPGDSHSFNQTGKVLALPVIAPWGKTGDAIDLALKLKPEYVLPVHDWHYHDEARTWLFGILNTALSPAGIQVLSPVSGIEHEV